MTRPHAPDDTRGVTLYGRLAQSLRSRIIQGDWKPSDQLPTIPELMKQFGVGSITVRQAFQLLTDEGLIESFRGKGTFVKDHAHAGFQSNLSEIISNPGGTDPDLKIKLLKRKTVDDLPFELKGRHTEQGRYVYLQKIHSYSGVPFSMLEVYVAESCHEAFPKGSDVRFRIPALVAQYGNGALAKNDQRISVCFADDVIAEYLDYSSSGALVKILRWGTDKNDIVLWASVSHFRADMFVLDIVEQNAPLNINTTRPNKT
jgi:GntR family transcriptional regulator